MCFKQTACAHQTFFPNIPRPSIVAHITPNEALVTFIPVRQRCGEKTWARFKRAVAKWQNAETRLRSLLITDWLVYPRAYKLGGSSSTGKSTYHVRRLGLRPQPSRRRPVRTRELIALGTKPGAGCVACVHDATCSCDSRATAVSVPSTRRTGLGSERRPLGTTHRLAALVVRWRLGTSSTPAGAHSRRPCYQLRDKRRLRDFVSVSPEGHSERRRHLRYCCS